MASFWKGWVACLVFLCAACGGGEWSGEGGPGLELPGWPGTLAGDWVQEVEGCPGAERRWSFFPPETFIETLSDPFACAGEAGEWYGGMEAGAGHLLDLTSEGPERFRRFVAAIVEDELNIRAFVDEGEGRCFFRHHWQTHLAQDFSDRRLGLRLCFDRPLRADSPPHQVRMQVWLYDDAGSNAPAATASWAWSFVLQARVDLEQNWLRCWPLELSEERLQDGWERFVEAQGIEASFGVRLSQALKDGLLPNWLWREGKLVEEAPGAWLIKVP
ncbi:MAG: hypothetical protein JRF33_11845 [Deltaproteobacteria bacterium]|nr:hypothetical protein [Deltaproteobacteria bacterium]